MGKVIRVAALICFVADWRYVAYCCDRIRLACHWEHVNQQLISLFSFRIGIQAFWFKTEKMFSDVKRALSNGGETTRIIGIVPDCGM